MYLPASPLTCHHEPTATLVGKRFCRGHGYLTASKQCHSRTWTHGEAWDHVYLRFVTYACLVISRTTGLGHRHHFQPRHKPHSPNAYATKTPLSQSGRKEAP